MANSSGVPAADKRSLSGFIRAKTAPAFAEPPPTGPTRASRVGDRFRSSAIVLPLSFVLGALTSLGQTFLPESLSSVANSAGGWSAMAFALVWLSRSRYLSGMVLGVASFYLLNVGYAVISDLRGYSWSLSLGNFFVLMSFVAGPPIGLAAAWMRSRSTWVVAIASSAFPAVLIGEGIYGLTVVAETTSPVYWIISIASGVAFVAAVSFIRLRSPAPTALSVGLTVIGAAAFLQIYGAAGSPG
ncbi:DUF6518 family protein [Arthrobacter zhaoguopingii]|uniref:DUF6518 family protein n=1 Tax=Arthrobacter zhaoguopingii TaxID=2681491 RepID=UPI00135973B1|nr:DUF6518 family protein [Arthrobacter zhaoguopingii]